MFLNHPTLKFIIPININERVFNTRFQNTLILYLLITSLNKSPSQLISTNECSQYFLCPKYVFVIHTSSHTKVL